MKLCPSVAWFCISGMRSLSTAIFFLPRIPETRHIVRQTSSQRNRKLPIRYQLLSFSILSCFISLFLLLRSSHSVPWYVGDTPVSGKHEMSTISYLHAAAGSIMRQGRMKSSLTDCDIYTGTWVYDGSSLMYNTSTCPFAETGFSCQENGRPDSDYLKWRWQPLACDIPTFNAEYIRRKLSGLQVAFVGDSMGRTQWESLICLLMADLPDKNSVYEVNGNAISKLRPYLAVRFSTFNFTIEYYRSPYLVQESAPPKHVPKRVRSTLKLDKLENSESKWLSADVLVFNTGHWWTPSKIFGRWISQ